MKICSIDNCNRKHKAKGLCIYHYYRSDEVKQRDRKRYQNDIEYQRQRSREKGMRKRSYHTKYSMERNKRFAEILGLKYTQFIYQLQKKKQEVKERDHNNCQVCNKPSQIVHHLLYRQFYPKLTLNSNNMIALCNDCHYHTHGRCLN